MKSIGIEAKRYRELQGITVEELHEEMNKSIPTNIDAIYSFESGEYNEKLYFLKIGQFTTFFIKQFLISITKQLVACWNTLKFGECAKRF